MQFETRSQNLPDATEYRKAPVPGDQFAPESLDRFSEQLRMSLLFVKPEIDQLLRLRVLRKVALQIVADQISGPTAVAQLKSPDCFPSM